MSQRNAVAPSRRTVAHLFRQTHCQNYLFVLWGYLNMALSLT
jgi:hypothetical protein